MILDSKIFNPQAKILVHVEKVIKFLKGYKTDPITVEIDPSNACNHSCPFCISGHIHLQKFKGTKFFDRRIMDPELLLRLSKEICKMDIQSVSFTGGGEPTLNPGLKDSINYIKKNSKIEIGMFTNGTNLKKFDLFETIIKNLTWVRISVDAGLKNSYNKMRVTNDQNNFDVVINNIKELVKIKKKLKSKITIGVGFVVSKHNFNEVVDFANLFKDIDVDYCQYKPEIIQIERNGSLNLSKQQISADFWLNQVIKSLDSAKDILGKKFECNSYKIEDLILDKSNYGRHYKKCLGSQLQPCIGADGNVYVCTNHRGHKEYSYGNIYEKSFKQIWNDIKCRKKIMNRIDNKEKFSKCSQLCKPHESNKILWDINFNLKNKKFRDELAVKSKKLKKNITHPNFI
jgi:cyclic pyranopterin phosphate synthase